MAGNQRYATPLHLFDPLNKLFQFDTDVCAEWNSTKCDRFIGPPGYEAMSCPGGNIECIGGDAFKTAWGMMNWCNHPFKEQGVWYDHAIEQSLNLGARTLLCSKMAMNTRWLHRALPFIDKVYLPMRRVSFINPDTGEQTTGSNVELMLCLVTPESVRYPHPSTPFIPIDTDAIYEQILKEQGNASS